VLEGSLFIPSHGEGCARAFLMPGNNSRLPPVSLGTGGFCMRKAMVKLKMLAKEGCFDGGW
jgi:hypothetical protein